MPTPGLPSWNLPHIVACILVAMTAVLLSFGALVTTYEAAMAVPDWPATYGHNLFMFPLVEWLHGPWDLFLEHGHRLLGATVGLVTLLLAGLVWWRGGTPLVQALTAAAVVLVVGQGILGGARVLLDDKTVAKVHACTGPLFFAVTVALATLTRRSSGGSPRGRVASSSMAVAAALVVAAYLQLVAGAQLRHLDVMVDPATFHRLVALHVVGAVAVLALAIGAVSTTAGHRAEAPAAWWWARGVLLAVICQWALGAGTWVVHWGFPGGLVPESWQFADPVLVRSARAAAIVTSHVVLGMLILGATVVLALANGVLEEFAGPRRMNQGRGLGGVA
jgi:cytochrome c oxidase assembly protein subunit 15